MAGLLPRLNGKQVVLTPSNEPLARLETALKSEHEWLVVDQFEELFTHCKNEAERKAFIEQLLALPRVILTMRADFLGECAVYPALRQAIEQHQCLVGPLAPEQLRTAMEKQAAQVGLHFEGGLTQRLMDDVTGEPGAMPLLQHALKLLWDHRQGPWLRAEEYEAMGGVRNAVANTADQFYGGLEEADQERVRDIFMRLTHLSDALAGEDPRDTRQRVRLADLVPAGAETAPVQELVAQLDEQHLVVVNEGEVEVVHEALIRHWPRLRKWIEENRAGLKLRESVRENALEWESHQRDESFLDHRGSRLEEALTLSEQPRFALNILEKAYLDACVNAVRREQVRREQLRFRITAGLVVGLVIMSAIAVFASLQWQRAELQRQESLARQLAANAQMLKADRPELSLLLGAQAFKINDNFETRSSLLSAAQCCSDALVTFLNGHTDSVWDVAFSPDGKWLASSGNDGSIIIWEVATHQPITRLTNPASTATIYTVAFSPSEKILAAGDSTGLITLYDTQSWQRLRQPLHGHTSMVLAAKFSKDGSLLVSGGADGQVLVWKMANRTLAHTFTGHTDWVWDIAISVDNQTVASVSRDKTLRLWNLEPGSSVPNLSVPASPSVSAAFYDDPEHPLLLTGDRTGSVVIWDLRPWQQKHEAPLPAPGLKVVAGATTEVWGLAFIPGQELSFVTGRSRGIINRNRIVPDAKYSAFKLQPEILGVTAHSIGLFRIDVSPDGKLIAAAGQDGLVSLWASQLAPNVYWHAAEVNNLQILDGEKNLLSIDKNGMVSRWETRSQNLVSQVRFNTRQVLRSAFSRDGSLAVTGNDQGAISLWEVQTGKRLQFLNQHQAAITSLAFSPHGDRFASSDNQGKVILWQIGANGKATPSEPFTDVHQSAIRVLLFSPDGNRLIGGGCGYPITFPKPDCSQGAIFVWDTQPALKLSYTFPGKAGFVWSMALNPANSDEVATGTPDGTITIWSLRTRSQHLSFRLATEVIPALAFSPDGSLLAVSAEGYKVLLYSTQTGQPYGQFFKEHDLAVNSLAFTANGERLFSASVDNTIVAHDLQPANWLVRTCRMINRNLTWAEWQQYLGEALPYQAVCPNLPLEPEPTNTPIP